ncbi:hypothetical protein JVT61DRAFT_3123 [Boletus reticuloceps]|uniref:G domain-containing protein n=1 Tax=Boletus reticuloceps TaxID=495285 RepID=A0A8I2YMV5_9AGAM|nr:hypothetical protein JVT61DRAFT_3123 [Boletus reticuloceps]
MVKLRKQTVYEDDRINSSETTREKETKNVIVFGESGVGKSSLINLIAGKKVCETSSGALGCTLEYRRHLLDLGDQHYAIWDTAGLDEGTQGTVPAEKAEAYLKQLLHELVQNNGVDLLVYCVRGTRVRSALLTNYHIFYSAICRRKVPIAIVITGLENQEGNMETWWYRNEPHFGLLKMFFESHACVTTLESSVENALLRERREVSRAAVNKMITNTCRTEQWRPPERSWIESAHSDIRAMLSPRDGYGRRLSTIIMCETSRDRPRSRLIRKRSMSFQNPVALHPLSFRSPISISNDSSRNKLPFEDGIKCTPERLFRVYQVPPRPPPPPEGTDEEIRKITVVKRAADLLIFCVRMEDTEPSAVKLQWEHFNVTYGGDLSPQIVVVVGALNQPNAEKWWKAAVGRAFAKNDVDVAHWPLDATEIEMEGARRGLQRLISDRCIDCSKVTLMKNEKLFRWSLMLDMSNLAALWGRPESNSRADGPPAEQDILTKYFLYNFLGYDSQLVYLMPPF